MREGFGFDVLLDTGKRGQFDIVVDGDVVWSRRFPLLKKIFATDWPEPEEIVELVANRQRG